MDKSKVLIRAKEFIYNNARLLDRKRYEYHFEASMIKGIAKYLQGISLEQGSIPYWCPLRSSYPGKFVMEEDIEIHLQALLDQQQEDGGWPALSIGTECEWRGWVTVNRLRTLNSYGII